MIRTIISRFRMVAPPTWIMVGMILVFGILAIPRILFGLQPLPGNEPAAAARRYLIVASIGLGIYRAVAFHPYFRPNYLRWLKSTPWTVRKQLPLGPLELVPEDSFAIGMLILLSAALPTPRSIELVNLFLFSHMLTQVGTFWRTGAPGFGYTAVMLLGFVPLFWAHPWLNLVILTSIYLVVHEGLWRCSQRFSVGDGGNSGRFPYAANERNESRVRLVFRPFPSGRCHGQSNFANRRPVGLYAG